MNQTSIVFNSIIFVVAITLYNTYGYIIPIYIIMGLLTLSTFAIGLAAAATIYGFIDAKDNIKKMNTEGKIIKDTKLITFMLHVIQGMSIYTIYVAGFAFTSGIFTASLGVAFIGNILRSIKGEKS
jgi:hypothetical protein